MFEPCPEEPYFCVTLNNKFVDMPKTLSMIIIYAFDYQDSIIPACSIAALSRFDIPYLLYLVHLLQ